MLFEVETLIHCPVCKEKYSQGSAKIVGRKGQAYLIHASCGRCQSSSLSVVTNSEEGGKIVTMGMVTDLNQEEAQTVLNQKPISVDEVIDMYEAIR